MAHQEDVAIRAKAYIMRGGSLEEAVNMPCEDRASALAAVEALWKTKKYDQVEASLEHADASGVWQTVETLASYRTGDVTSKVQGDGWGAVTGDELAPSSHDERG